jgi:hypothetical protein
MQEKPVFLKFGHRWINIAAVTHIDIAEQTKVATLYVGAVPVIENDSSAYQFFKAEGGGWFFTQPAG